MRTIAAAVSTLALLLAGCGGDDGKQRADDASTIRYVALGDSIARGAAIGGAIPHGRNRTCRHTNALVYNFSRWDTSRYAYPTLVERDLAALTKRPVSLLDLACSGLSAKDLANPEVDLLQRAVDREPDVVTVLIGANDVVVQCLPKRLRGVVVRLNPFASKQQALERYAKCDPARIESGIADVRRSLPHILERLDDDTDAQVFVGTYYSATGIAAENRVAREINGAIEAAVAGRSDRFHLVSGVAEAFRAHDCRAPKRATWLLGWDLCLHPNRAGQRALAGRFFAVMEPFAARFGGPR